MNLPNEQQWLRVEELARQWSNLPPDQVAANIVQLAAAGESATVLTVLGTWLALPPPTGPFDTGSIIGGRYTLKEKLGEGSMGSVWRAKQELIGRDVAVKLIHPVLITPGLSARFLHEMELLGQLDHPGIIKIFDAGTHEHPGLPAIPFFAMELIRGLPLDRWADAHRADRPSLLRTAKAICESVQSAHERRIVHRDLKPSNILVRETGQPVVLDFGIARLTSVAAGDEYGVFSGTPQYAAPEQHLGRDRDFRSGESVDVYAMGAILFQMLSGRRLFQFPHGASLSDMRRAVLENPLPRLSEVVPECPTFLDEIVARALRRDPADRFYSIAGFGRAIARAGARFGPVEERPAPWIPAPGAIVPGTGWKLVEKLGEGGAGQVWVGLHDQLAERRVFKFCDTEDKARTLKRELTLFRLLKERVGRNPHFIQLHEVSLDEPPWYLMMDYAEARALDCWAAAQPGGLAAMPEHLRLEIVAQIAEGLQAAHESGILHRDIKPSNILVESSKRSAPLHVFIADFGIGQIIANELLLRGTRLGFTRTVTDLRSGLSGTMLYMAPEVLEGNPATVRSDIYSLGVLFWQLLIANLTTALDAADWSSRIEDPLLREDLTRCLAGSPQKRWAGAGELAASIRALPARRAAVERRKVESAARERAAYRRGVLRATAVAAVVVAGIAWLAWTAWVHRRAAESARGEITLEQAATLAQTDFALGRRERGMRLLDTAVKTTTNRTALRSAAASVLGMADLVRVPVPPEVPKAPSAAAVPPMAGESCRITSGDGALVAVARDLDGLNGAVDLVTAATRERLSTIERKKFPWVPIAQPGLLTFSPDKNLLAIGGPASSRHILLCNVANGSLHSYLYHASDARACGWHPSGRIFVSGCADGRVLVWDTAMARKVKDPPAGHQFDLPPSLDTPAQDTPAQTLLGHLGAVEHLAFSSDGRWLASIDAIGYMRIHGGFSSNGLPQFATSDSNGAAKATFGPAQLPLAVAMRLEDVQQIKGLEGTKDGFIIFRSDAPAQAFRVTPSDLPRELYLGPGISSVAWNSDSTELCAITATDIYWLHSNPLSIFFAAPGKNPVGVAAADGPGNWAVAKDNQYAEYAPMLKAGAWVLKKSVPSPLVEAEPGQGTRTAMAATLDGRLAIYHGRRVQFFAKHTAARMQESLVARGTDRFREIFWDQPGRLLAIVFALPSGSSRVETWKTSSDFPPQCKTLGSVPLEAGWIAPANDGSHYLIRNSRQGLLLLDPATNARVVFDGSSTARQDAPFAASSEGAFLALVADRNQIRLLHMPEGLFFADLHNSHQAAIISLVWDATGRRLAAVTEDGYVQVWDLGAWQQWFAEHALQH
jgi:serine/threonine protein kinase